MNNNKSSIIGTPLSPSATKVMLLGSGELGKEVIIALQRLGIETIAVDRYPNAPGHQVAHRSHVITMTDGVALRALVEREQPDVIVPEIEAIDTGTLMEIERSGCARVIPTARATHLTMNREGIRRLAAETLGLPTSRYAFANSLEELRLAIKKWHWLPLRDKAGNVFIGQRSIKNRQRTRSRGRMALRRQCRQGKPGARDCGIVYSIRL